MGMARVIIVMGTVCLLLVGASAGSGSLRGTLKTANSSGLVANADVQKEDNVELSWAPWPCPKKGPWPAPPLCGEGRIEFQYDVNQSEFEQREDNVKSPLCGEGGGELQDLVQKEDNVKLLLRKKHCIKVDVKLFVHAGASLCVGR